MCSDAPPGWGSDSLADFIDTARHNIFATFTNLGAVYSLLLKVDQTYRKVIDNLSNSPDWFAGFFLLKAHASYLGALRLSLSGQTPEAYMVLRGCLESSLYGLRIHQNPESGETWLRRHDDDESNARVRTEFRISNILESLESVDRRIYAVAKYLYKLTIDYGAHPNERALTSNLTQTNTESYLQFNLNYLTGDTPELKLCLKTNIEIGICSLYIFKFIYRERFDILGISDDLERHRRDIDSISWD
jgi:hypothetical protein